MRRLILRPQGMFICKGCFQIIMSILRSVLCRRRLKPQYYSITGRSSNSCPPIFVCDMYLYMPKPAEHNMITLQLCNLWIEPFKKEILIAQNMFSTTLCSSILVPCSSCPRKLIPQKGRSIYEYVKKRPSRTGKRNIPYQ